MVNRPPRRLLPALSAVVLLAAACGGPDLTVRSREEAPLAFVPQVVEFEGDVGTAVSISGDADGNPHLAYLTFEEEPAPGEPPAPPEPGAPALPAVNHAHLVEGVWTRTTVAEGAAVGPEDRTAIAVDGDGIHHVVWTQEGALLYANNAEEGEFGEPETVAREAVGPSIAAADDGSIRVAFYEPGQEAEGPGALVRVATRQDDRWSVETAAEAAAPEEGLTTGIGIAGDQVLVAYVDQPGLLLARSTEGPWRSETVDPEAVAGASVALDGDGNPHLAYSTDREVRHAHEGEEGRWDITPVAEAPSAPNPPVIAVAQDGAHHVAWQDQEGIGYATNEGGDFAEEEVTGSGGGTHPAIAAGAEGVVNLAWYEPEDGDLRMGIRTEEPPLLAVPSPEEAGGPPAGGGEQPPPADCPPPQTQLAIAAPEGAFSQGFAVTCVAAPAGEPLTIDFDNSDPGQLHNVAIYTDETASEPVFQGETITGPDMITYQVDPIEQTGNLFFRCDVHPTTMTGTFVVAGEDGGGGE